MTRTAKILTATVATLAVIVPFASGAQALDRFDDDLMPPDVSACEFWGNCAATGTN